ncbi:class I SAM-dependent methyltransferase, partial [Streptomyces sp. T-3]|nr:class I SAM-dependent methyltransferase [Streptomyces sp. T-3]
AHSDHPIAAPLSDQRVDQLLAHALPRGDERVLDLGCGEAEWLIWAVANREGVRADGVDLSEPALARGREHIAQAGLSGRIALHHQDAAEFNGDAPYDLVVCVGSTHAFGGLLPTLEAARKHLAPGGAVLVGDGFWERPPTKETLQVGFAEDEYVDLAATVDLVERDGWIPLHGHVSTQEEWDDYEWSWTGSLTRWALDNPQHPESEEVLATAKQHRAQWLSGYRGTLGFVTLLLRQEARPEPHTLLRLT